MPWKNLKTNKQLPWSWRKQSKRKKKRELNLKIISYRRNTKSGIMQNKNKCWTKKNKIQDSKTWRKKLWKKLSKRNITGKTYFKNTLMRNNKNNMKWQCHTTMNPFQLVETVINIQVKVMLGVRLCNKLNMVHKSITN